MKHKHSHEFDKFNKVMDGLLAVPHSEIHKKVETKARQKTDTPPTSSVSSRTSSHSKKRVV